MFCQLTELEQNILLRHWQTRTHCCRHTVADTNVSPFARARNICCGHKFCVRDTKMFLILFRNMLCPQQMFPSLRSPRNIMGNNRSPTMRPRLPGPLSNKHLKLSTMIGRDSQHFQKIKLMKFSIHISCLLI